jgi:hypothetical protein
MPSTRDCAADEQHPQQSIRKRSGAGKDAMSAAA